LHNPATKKGIKQTENKTPLEEVMTAEFRSLHCYNYR